VAAPETPPEEEPHPASEGEYIRIPKHVFNVLVTVNIVIILVLAGALYFQRSGFQRSGRNRLK
jgi:hypothetical protein